MQCVSREGLAARPEERHPAGEAPADGGPRARGAVAGPEPLFRRVLLVVGGEFALGETGVAWVWTPSGVTDLACLTDQVADGQVCVKDEGMGEASRNKILRAVGPDEGVQTIVVSDLHLTEAETPDPSRPLWKRYKFRDLFIDDSFARMLDHVVEEADGSIELVFNGDTFDFDIVSAVPNNLPTNLAEQLRGLNSEEEKSRYKIWRILDHHPVWVTAIRQFVLAGNEVVFVVGNHDVELHWPGVQAEILDALDLPAGREDAVRFCEWFYVSQGDTLIEHGNQYDAYCVVSDPVHPFVRIGGRLQVRIPFGDVAGRFMLNGMGLFNPYAEEAWSRSFVDYVRFFFQYLLPMQPFAIFAYLWSAVATLIVSLRYGFLPAERDPLALAQRVEDVARRANVRPSQVFALRTLRVHPAIFNPWKIARELWLDRVLLLGLLCLASWQIVSFVSVFVVISPLWALVPFGVLLPFFVFYASSVRSDIVAAEHNLRERAPVAAKVVGVKRVIVGHTHNQCHERTPRIELVNTGTWSPGFRDVECEDRMSTPCLAWIQPNEEGHREVRLFVWRDPGLEQVEPVSGPGRRRWRFLRRRRRAIGTRRARVVSG